MKFERFSLRVFELNLRSSVTTARGSFSARQGIVLELADEAGNLGVGESMPLEAFTGETLRGTYGFMERACASLQGRPVPAGLEQVERYVWELVPKARPSVRYALELALLDLLSQAEGKPLAKVLNARAAAFVSSGELCPSQGHEALVAEATRAVKAGVQTLKVKVGTLSLAEDLERVSGVVHAVGPRVRVRVDANGAWLREEAERAWVALAPLGIELCEQPVGAEDLRGLAYLRALDCIPVAADESLAAFPDGRELLLAEGGPRADVLVLKPAVLGGVLPCLRLAKAGAELGVASYVTHAMDGAIGRAGALHLAAALPLNKHSHGLSLSDLERGDFAPWLWGTGGRVALPEGPGVGALHAKEVLK